MDAQKKWTVEEELKELNKSLDESDFVTYYDVTYKTRLIHYVYKRAVFIYYLRKKKYSLHQIGDMLNKNHATIINALKYENKENRNRIFDIIKATIDFKISNIERPKICPCCNQLIANINGD